MGCVKAVARKIRTLLDSAEADRRAESDERFGAGASKVTSLNGWKEIANYLGRGVRTVQRWERLGLPVHRARGERRSAVSALAPEVDAWLASSPTGYNPLATLQAENAKLRAENENLRLENERLRHQLAEARTLAQPPVEYGRAVAAPPPADIKSPDLLPPGEAD